MKYFLEKFQKIFKKISTNIVLENQCKNEYILFLNISCDSLLTLRFYVIILIELILIELI